MRRLLLPCLLLLAVAFGAGLIAPVWADPTALAARTRFTDGHLLGIALWAEPMRHGVLPSLHTDVVAWPLGADLRPLLWPSTLLGALLGAPLALALTFTLVPAFNLVSGWILGAVLGRDLPGRALLGAALAFHPWVIETLVNGQVEQAVLGGAALQLAAAMWAAQASAPRAAILLPGIVTALVGWAAPHVALAGCLVVGAWALVELVRGRDRARWQIVLAVVAVGAFAVQMYHAPSFSAGVHVFAPKGSAGRPTGLVDLPEVTSLRGLLLPPPRAPNLPVLHPNFLGFVLLGAAVWGAVRERAARPPVGIALVLVVLSLGSAIVAGGVTIPLPWAALAAVAPTVAQSMSAYRLVMGAVLALAVAASAVAWRPRWLVVVIGLALVEAVSTSSRPLPLRAQAAPVDPSRAALAVGTGPVLDLPMAGPSCPTGAAHYLIEAAATGRPVPLEFADPRAGYARVPRLQGETMRLWAQPDCAARLTQRLEDWPFGSVVLHRHDRDCPPPPGMAACLTAALGAGTTAGSVTWWDVP